MRRAFVVARDYRTACRQASNLGLRPGFWTYLDDPRQVFERRGYAVVLVEGYRENEAWPAIEAEINTQAGIGHEVRIVDVEARRSWSRVALAALIEGERN